MSSSRRPKAHSRRQRQEDNVRHWLDEGGAGQQSLFLELDPLLYALDSDCARLAVAKAHQYDGDEKRPFAVLAPPAGTIGWQVGMLARHFNVYLWAETKTEEFDAAADYFGIEVIAGDLQSEVTHGIDFVAVTDPNWESPSQWRRISKQVCAALAPEGIACFAVRAEVSEDALAASFEDGSLQPVHDLCRDLTAFSPSARLEVAARLCEVDRFERERVTNFLKRHRDFFGKEAQGFLAERLSDGDFIEAYNETQTVGVLLTVREGRDG